MKKRFLLLVCIAAFNSVYAQKPDREKVGSYSYIQLPLMPLPKEYKTYKLEAKAAGNDPYTRDQINGGVMLAGFNKSTSNETDFTITFEEYPFGVTRSDAMTNVVSTKKDGVETKTTYYFYEYTIRYQARVEVKRNNGESIFSKQYDLGGSYKTDQSTSSSTAWDNMNEKIKSAKSTLLSNAIRSANADLENNFAFPTKKMDIAIFKVKQKKYEYPEYEEAFNIVKEGAEMTVFKDENATASANDKFKPAFEKWEGAMKEVDLEDKKARIDKDIAVVTYYNQAVLYFLMKDYDKTLAMTDKCFELKKNYGEADDLKRITLDMKSRASKNSMIN